MTALSDPLALPCGQVLPNRLMKAALSEGLGSPEFGPDERIDRLYQRWGAGGFGLIVTGNVMVDRTQLGEPGNVVVEDERHLAGLRRWAEAGKAGGARIWMQINHPGRQANPLASKAQPVAPSAIALDIPGLPTPRELTDAEITDLVRRYATTARVAEAAGFDGVQIHGAHGYLVSQFLSPLANQRTDRWGGDAPRRARFVLEVVRAIRAEVADSFAVAIKLNSADFQRGGFTEDESRAVISLLAAERLDLIEISGGSYESPAMMGRPVTRSASTAAREAYFLDYARSVRALAGSVPLAVTGGFRTRAAMDEAVAAQECDVVGLGRPSTLAPGAAAELLRGHTTRLHSRQISLRLPAALTTLAAVKAVEGALDLQWHTDQLHRLGAGQDPDPGRTPWFTAATMLQRNGLDAFRSRRSSAARPKDPALRKFEIERAVGRYLANPAVRALGRIGVRTSFATELETTGRKSGQTRVVPVSVAFDDTGAWVISQHGTRSGWAANIGSEPKVRVRQGDRWRTGVAELRPGDDVVARARSFAPNPVFAGLTAATFRTLQSNPVSVRITFTD
ncbi:nitroreductase family deazaflavin-dependent oxidoreductase [Nocardia sp. NPDC059177]|uniref:nitroreductase family deazaflavin-dependent oxidoreductase n=1 Tax=Nocardia sp. NPDC059177 TaxID=3346759 RepID=UPI003673E33C